MMAFLARVLLQIFVLEQVLWSALCSDCLDSCYSFHTGTKNWDESNIDCTINNGRLISLETESEWNFINKEIQNIDIVEWFIGLTGEKGGSWKWENGKPLTIEKWQAHEPNGEGSKHGTYLCAVMAKNYPPSTHGLFNDVLCSKRRPYICEYKKRVTSIPGSNKIVCCPSKTTQSTYTTTTTMTTATTTTNSPYTTQTPKQEQTTTTSSVTVETTPIIWTSKGKYYHHTTQVQTPEQEKATTTSSVTIETTPIVWTSKGASPTAAISAETAQEKPFSYIFIIVIVLVVVLLVMVCIFSVVCCKMNKRSGKLATSVESNTSGEVRPSVRTRETNLNMTNDSYNIPKGLQTAGADAVIYAEVNSDVATYPNPTYSEVQEYLPPVDAHVQPLSPPPTDYYSNVNETLSKQRNNVLHHLNTEIDGKSEAVDTYESVGVSASIAPPAVYAVVDKSKKTRDKRAGVGIATEKNKAKNDTSTYLYESEISSGATPAIYAVVNKSTKENKAGVGIATKDENKKERVDDQDSTYENTRKDNETYEQISKDLHAGLDYEKLQPEENCDNSGPEVPLYSSVDSG